MANNKRRHSLPSIFVEKFLWLVAILTGLSIAPILIVISIFHGLDTWSLNTPIATLANEPLPQQSKILAKDGSVIATFYGENRIPVKPKDIPEVLKQALVATEDARFYKHGGVDWIATLHALQGQLTGKPRGGSGITQQYVKNILITHAKTQAERDAASGVNLGRKVREAFLAIKVDSVLSKEQILTGYLNTVFFGDGAYGIGAASSHYFNKTPKELTLSEAALLIGIVQNPSGLNPIDYPAQAKARRAHVLHRMQVSGYITLAQESKANGEEINLKVTSVANGCYSSLYPFYCQWVRDTMANSPIYGATAELRQEFLYKGGLTVYTNLDVTIQKDTDNIAQKVFSQDSQVATAIAIVEPGTGKVLALSTSKQWGNKPGQTQLVLPVIANFQPGSTFKPITAITAIEQGISPDIAFYAGNTFTPKDRNSPVGGFGNAESYEGGYYNMTQALTHSVNTWFVELEDKIGVKAVAQTGYDMGMKSLPLDGEKAITEKDASLTLGSYETSPLQMASVYATIASHGIACDPVGISSIKDARGKDIPVDKANCHRVIKASTANTVTKMLTQVVLNGTGTQANIKGKAIAGKTGTTTSSAAAWFVGFNPLYATAVWVGDPRGGYRYPLKDLRAYGKVWQPVWGGGVPAKIWNEVMTPLSNSLEDITFAPAGGDVYAGGQEIMPDLRGLTMTQATNIINTLGYDVDRPSKVNINSIVSGSAPKPGEQLKTGTKIVLYSETK